MTRILEGPTEALEMFLGSRVINDGAPLYAFLDDALGAPRVSAQLAEAAAEIHARSTAQNGDATHARRWACSLIGHVACDAVLAAATPPGLAVHLARAEHRFGSAIASAIARASSDERLGGGDLQAWARDAAVSIGDIEQSLAGEDHDLDDFLRQGVHAARPQPSAVAAPPAPEAAASPLAVPARDARPSEAPVPIADIERFIVQHVAAALKMRKEAIDPARSVFDYGVDSVTAVTLCAGLEEWLGVVCDPDVVYAIPVIGRLAGHVASLPRPRR